MVIVATSSFVRLVEVKETDDCQNRHVGHVEAQDVATMGWVDDSSNESVESSGRMENEAVGCTWKAHPVASFP